MIHLNLRNLNRFLSVFVLALIVFVVYELFRPINPSTIKYVTVASSQTLEPGSLMSYSSSSRRYVDTSVQTAVIRRLGSLTNNSLQPIPRQPRR